MSNVLFDGLLAKADLASQFAYVPSEKGDRTFSYKDVLGISARFANTLVSLGVKPGDRVAVQVPKSIEAMILYLGTVRAGAVFLPLNTAYTASEIRYFLENAEPAVFICDPDKHSDYIPLAKELNIKLETLGVWENHSISAGTLADAGLEASTEFNTVARTGDDLAAILYTSGTTGRSKGTMLTHDNLLSNTQTLESYWRFTKNDVLLHALPIFHTHGLFVATNLIVITGASLIFLEGFNNDAVIDNLPNATTMMGVPTFYTRLLSDERFDKPLVQHMRLFISGSAPLLAETHIEFEQRTGHRILERYGMTETNMNTSNPYKGERRAGTVGFPLPEVEIRIVDAESGKLLGADEVGSLEVRGPNVFSGYWKMPEKTKEEFREDGYFITGDLAKIDSDGYIHIVGRGKDLIISGGFNIYPKEVELALDEEEEVLESAVIGVPHPDFGEGVVAVIVEKRGTQFDKAKTMENMLVKLAKFKQPKSLIVVDELPRNTMGKVQKNLLREEYKSLLSN